MTKEGFESYMLQIENSIKNRKKGKKFIDLNIIKKKNLNVKKNKNDVINIDEDDEESKLLSDEVRDENQETFISSTKNKRGRKKATLSNIFKTTKNIDEPTTREETSDTLSSVFRVEKIDDNCATFRVLAPNTDPETSATMPYIITNSSFINTL